MAAHQEKEAGKRRALGKGLESLLPRAARPAEAAQEDRATAVDNAAQGRRTLDLELERIDSNPYQTRSTIQEEALGELAASIRAVGVIQPILVRAIEGGRYQLIAGQRRWLASKLAGKTTVSAVVAVMNDAQAMEATIVENLQRADLSPIEQARAFDRLSREFHMTQEQIAIRTGKDRATVANFLRLLRLPPDLQDALSEGRLSFGHARALLALENPDQIRRAALRVLALALSVRQTETFVKGILNPERRDKAREKKERVVDPNVREMETALREALGMRVEIEDKHGRGRVVIEYADLEGFDSLMERLTRG